MTNYRRLRVPGGTYFFTVAAAQRGGDLLTREIHALRAAYAKTHSEMPFKTEAIVVLPDHIHAVWTLPQGDADFSERWRRIKARFSRTVGYQFARSSSKRVKRETGLWQRRFWEHKVRGAADFEHHVSLCWTAPVACGLVPRPADWAHSSIHREIENGHITPNWTGPDQASLSRGFAYA